MKKAKSSIWLSIISFLEKILGFAKNLLLSFFYGTSFVSDVFNIMLTIPDTLFSLIANGINASYIPISTSIENDGERYKFTSEMISVVVVITIVISSICMFFPNIITSIFAPGFSVEAKALTNKLIRISIWSICFTGANNVIISYLQYKKKFVSSALTPIILNVAQCVAVVLSFYFNSIFLAFGIVIGNVISFCVLIALAYKTGYRFSFIFGKSEYIRRVLILSLPVMLGASANRINIVIDKAIASSLREGGISGLAYADSLILFIKSICSVPIITIAFPTFSLHGKNKDYASLTNSVSKALLPLCVILIPIVFGCIALSTEIVSIIYGRGAFSSDSISITSICLISYAIGLPAFCVRDLLVKVHYANFDTKSPTINVIVGIVLNIFLNFILSHFYGVAGLALASSIAAYVIVFLMAFSLRRFLIYSQMKYLIYKILRILFSSIVMFFAVSFISSLMSDYIGVVLSTLTSTVMGMFLYIVLVILFRVFSKAEIKELLK